MRGKGRWEKREKDCRNPLKKRSALMETPMENQTKSHSKRLDTLSLKSESFSVRTKARDQSYAESCIKGKYNNNQMNIILSIM
jgi:hypothetical protein